MYRIFFSPTETIWTDTPEEHAIAVKRYSEFSGRRRSINRLLWRTYPSFLLHSGQKTENAYTFAQNRWTVDQMFTMYQNEPTFRAY